MVFPGLCNKSDSLSYDTDMLAVRTPVIGQAVLSPIAEKFYNWNQWGCRVSNIVEFEFEFELARSCL